MCRLRFIDPEESDDLLKSHFKKLGMVNNIFCIMANSEPVLDLFITANERLDGSSLPPKIRRMIFLAVSQFNGCDYCLAYHTRLVTEAGLMSGEACLEARRMRSADPKCDAVLQLVSMILKTRGKVSDGAIDRVRKAGYGDDAIMEIIATISLAMLANMTANVAKPEMDFLPAPPLEEA